MDIQTDTCAMTFHAKWRRWRGQSTTKASQSMSKSLVLSIASSFQLMLDRTGTLPTLSCQDNARICQVHIAHRLWQSQVFGETDRSHCRVWGWYSGSVRKSWKRAMPWGIASRARSDTEFPIAILSLSSLGDAGSAVEWPFVQAETQTDFILDRPPSPLFMPAKAIFQTSCDIVQGQPFFLVQANPIWWLGWFRRSCLLASGKTKHIALCMYTYMYKYIYIYYRQWRVFFTEPYAPSVETLQNGARTCWDAMVI